MPFTFNPEPAAEALAFFRNKGWLQGFDYRDVWRAEHTVAFTVAKAMELDVLAAIRHEVDKALSEGVTFARFKHELQPTLERMGWWGRASRTDPVTGQTATVQTATVQLGSPARLRTIYRTNLRTARAAGQWARIERTRETTHPYLIYRLGPSRRHREQHVAWNGLMLRADDPWWQSHYPPNGWGCKCRVRQVSNAEASRRGLRLDTAPAIRRRRVINKRTRREEEVPIGIDPGWDYHPGAARLQHLQQTLATKQRETAALLGSTLPPPPLPTGLA